MRRSISIILAIAITFSLILAAKYGALAQDKSKFKETAEGKKVSDEERYATIVRNNLFMPLGSGGEVKREDFMLAGILGDSAFIQMMGSDRSFYVIEGQSFANGAKLIRIGKDSVTILHEGVEKELTLAGGTTAGQGGNAKGGEEGWQRNYGKDGDEMEFASREEKERRSREQKEQWEREQKERGEHDWARNMSTDQLHDIQREIEEHIEGMRMKGVENPEEYEGAIEKMESVERAIAERGD
jgi:hypothetical protein